MGNHDEDIKLLRTMLNSFPPELVREAYEALGEALTEAEGETKGVRLTTFNDFIRILTVDNAEELLKDFCKMSLLAAEKRKDLGEEEFARFIEGGEFVLNYKK